MDVVCNIPTGNLNFLDMKIIKIKKKNKKFSEQMESSHISQGQLL